MTVAPHLLGIKISNFRSIVEPIEVPLKNKITFLVGQNNSGKTGILRFIGLLLNTVGLAEEDRSSLTSKQSFADYIVSAGAILEFSNHLQHLRKVIIENSAKNFTLVCELPPSNKMHFTEDLFSVINARYFNNSDGWFIDDFGQSSSASGANLNQFLNALIPRLDLPKTIYVPSHRMILQGVAAMPQYGQLDFPGTKLSLHTIVEELSTLSRPHGNPTQRENSRAKLANICSFVAYCLEVENIKIEIPDGKQTIYISINGNEQPISNLGSGIEQLIVIGMGSFAFPNQLVLIDEPEIHFHPRTQKRMMKYLYDNADAKFVIATHSAAILDSVEADIVQVWQENHQCLGRTVQNNSDHYAAIRNLGHSPSELVLANFVIWVEGPSDRIYFNHWIHKLDGSLVEGTDYAIIFYGGSVLARHGFEDDGGEDDLVKSLSISRNFAVYMDSDKKTETDKLKSRVERVANEVANNHGLSWISDGREIENYIPASVLSQITSFEFNAIEKWTRVVKKEEFNKVKLAETACSLWGDEWPLDLKARCDELVARIQAAR